MPTTHIIDVLNLFWKYYVSIFLHISGGGGDLAWHTSQSYPSSKCQDYNTARILFIILPISSQSSASTCQLSLALSAPLLGPLSQYLTFLPLGNLRSEKIYELPSAKSFVKLTFVNSVSGVCAMTVEELWRGMDGLLLYLSLPHPL